MLSKTSLILAMAAMASSLAATPGQAEETNLGSEVPDASSIIQLFAPDQPAEGSSSGSTRTRSIGLEPLKPKFSEPKSQRAISLQIQFGSNSDELGPEAVSQLRPVGEAMASNRLKSFDFVVEGHTDSVGATGFNMRLSERRAESVKRFLINEYGINASRITAVGKGEMEPLDTFHPRSPVNRRVRIVASP
jgi:outer membrane protein OmpA-like peptidoglycan-associated protein